MAWRNAAHGGLGFYGAAHGRAEDHFTTSVMSSDAVARRVIDLALPALLEVAASGTPLTVTDVGAADGTLLRQLRQWWPDALRPLTTWRGLDVRPRPTGLDSDIEWRAGDVADTVSRLSPGAGLVVAHELLDDIPCDIVETDDDGALRLVLVDPVSGIQSLGPMLDDHGACARLGVDGKAMSDWCSRWWPRREPAARIEVGSSRDEVWRQVSSLVTDGVRVAVDYAHVTDERARGDWDGGTLTAYRDGRLVSPRPVGTCNITAHVALDACAAAVPSPATRLFRPDPGRHFWWLVQSTRPLP